MDINLIAILSSGLGLSNVMFCVIYGDQTFQMRFIVPVDMTSANLGIHLANSF